MFHCPRLPELFKLRQCTINLFKSFFPLHDEASIAERKEFEGRTKWPSARRGQKVQNLSCAESGFRRRLASLFERPTIGDEIDNVDGSEYATISGLTQKNVTKNSTCDILGLQGKKPLHTSMLVKRLQLTFSVSGSHSEYLCFTSKGKERGLTATMRSAGRAGCHESGLSVLNGGFRE